MKTSVRLALAATLAATATASPSHHHGHRHLHAKKDATKVEKREPDVVTKVVAGPTETVYQLGNDILNADDAEKGLSDGEFIVVGESTPTYTPSPAPSTSKDLGGQFIESKSTTATPLPPPPPSSPPPPPPSSTTTSTPAPPPSTTAEVAMANAAASMDDASSSSGGGDDSDFPSGKVKCSEFPSKWGAVPLDWLGLSKWSGLQKVPGYSDGASSISDIITGIFGDDCSPGTMCSYACKPGYQKSQWSTAQGSTGQSVGGLFCNSQGYLELTRPSVKQLCTPGEGGISIKNDLDEVVATCRTDYPGTESMVIPAVAQPGQTIPLTNPLQSGYYQWQEKQTSAQYYINPKGVSAKEGCLWTSPTSPHDRGNWAAVIAGVGMDDSGVTYLSLFMNKPTSSAQPDFNMEIIGGNSKCGYHNGAWIGGESGCTTAVAKGEKATIRYY